MGFFDELDLTPPSLHEPEPKRVRWRGDSEDTVGTPVDLSILLAKNDDHAIFVSSALAFPAGFSFALVAVSRLNPPREPFGHFHPRMKDRDLRREMRLGIGFSDGTKSFSWTLGIPPHLDDSPRLMRNTGGGGGGRKWSQGFWCEPLPPGGPMTFVCEWREYGIEETSVEVDGDRFIEAASRATPLWPEDQDVPPDEDDPQFGYRSGHRWSAYGKFRRAE